jgi:uncharacterized protein
MVASGRISNVTPFGAFVDLGLTQDGLVHLSELSQEFIRDPFEIVQPGDLVTVKVLSVDLEKKQISLSMKGVEGVSQKNQDLVKRKNEQDKERQAIEVARQEERRQQEAVRQAARPPRPEGRRNDRRPPRDSSSDRGHSRPRRDGGPGPARPSSSKSTLTHSAFANLADPLKQK